MDNILQIKKGWLHHVDDMPFLESDAYPGFRRKVFSTENIMITLVDAKKGAKGKLHTHEAEQIMYLLEGKVKFKIKDQEKILSPGSILGVGSNESHSIDVLEDSKYVEIFHPIRLDLFLGYILK